MFIVVSYDVVDDRRRTKVHKALKNFGAPVQYSVFECQLDEKTLARLQKRLRQLVDVKEDSVRFYQLCEGCVSKVQVMGVGQVTQLLPYRIVGGKR
ncbi:MAG: CRISPR-associated endonuclease Cas2 [Anaerolineae bacterium]|nr:CRISPR-associated endonuclease Cas2 [Anaerolineae bacterium]